MEGITLASMRIKNPEGSSALVPCLINAILLILSLVLILLHLKLLIFISNEDFKAVYNGNLKFQPYIYDYLLTTSYSFLHNIIFYMPLNSPS